MEKEIKKYEKEFLAKGESAAMALILAQTKHPTDEFTKLHNDIVFIKCAIVANYGERELKKMNKNE